MPPSPHPCPPTSWTRRCSRSRRRSLINPISNLPTAIPRPHPTRLRDLRRRPRMSRPDPTTRANRDIERIYYKVQRGTGMIHVPYCTRHTPSSILQAQYFKLNTPSSILQAQYFKLNTSSSILQAQYSKLNTSSSILQVLYPRFELQYLVQYPLGSGTLQHLACFS